MKIRRTRDEYKEKMAVEEEKLPVKK